MQLLPDRAPIARGGPPSLFATKRYIPCEQINCTKPAADKMACAHRVLNQRKEERRAKGRLFQRIVEAKRQAQQGAHMAFDAAELRAIRTAGVTALPHVTTQCPLESAPDGLM